MTGNQFENILTQSGRELVNVVAQLVALGESKSSVQNSGTERRCGPLPFFQMYRAIFQRDSKLQSLLKYFYTIKIQCYKIQNKNFIVTIKDQKRSGRTMFRVAILLCQRSPYY